MTETSAQPDGSAPANRRRRPPLPLVVVLVTSLAAVVVLGALGSIDRVPPPMDGTEEATAAPPSEEPVAPSRPEPTAEPTAEVADARVGLHFTPEEVRIWRQRARSGPYRVQGDASEHSPGDWERIRDNARSFLEDPHAAIWEGPERRRRDGCVRPVSRNEPHTEPVNQLRDAAFSFLLFGGVRYQEEVRDALLAQATEPGVDFSNRDLWCEGVIHDGPPSFAISHWLTKLMYAYDYLGADSFAPEERRQLNAWFYDAAAYWQEDLNSRYTDIFPGRWSRDYDRPSNPAIGEFTPLNECGTVDYAFVDSQPICSLARHYNNRRAGVARYLGLAAIKLERDGFRETEDDIDLKYLRDSAKLFVEEWLKYSVYSDGYSGEFERWNDRLPDLGWAYGNAVLVSVLVTADALARDGDPSLYQFETRQGAFGTESGEAKTLLEAARSMGRYVDGTYERYAGLSRQRQGNRRWLIDGVHTSGSSWYGLHDIQVAIANVYYRDDYLFSMYTRTGEGMPGYTESPATAGRETVWTGDWGTLPAMLFMFGQMEAEVRPY